MVEKNTPTGFWPAMFEPFRQAGTRLADWLSPAAEASQDDGAYRIAMELPGVAEEDNRVELDGLAPVRAVLPEGAGAFDADAFAALSALCAMGAVLL